ncbi:hypothetical protein BIY24_11220 [Halobacteriovorax marinus]|uniref:lytic transglycosylase domain-containing protein n=1 Tax=Halobacteriovorax marinus TaxID=97084 RepID=UPI000BC2E9DE|nr:lytic transglycosylase domain-containing protein [Halobacteriovorax marinus]ATH08499.1 hypothetical protein BIY24_11220 [Halobacteriovorax marinus]
MKNLSILLVLLVSSSCSHIGPLLGKKKPQPRSSIASLTSNKSYDSVKINIEETPKVEKKSVVKKKVVQTTDPIDQEKSFLEKIFPATVSSVDKKGLNLRYKEKHYNFWKKYFSKREKERFQRHMSNGVKFESIVKEVLKEHKLPADLFYVGLIESGYNTHIRSHASAVGPWQFIKGTGKRYGLKIDRYLDERRNIYKASHAAANYFKDLYNIFGSWELALCAYNAGEYRIINAIRRGNTRDYRELVRKKLIPRETINYVPKVAAAKYLFENRKKYGLRAKRFHSDIYTNVEEVEATRSFSLSKVAKGLRVSLKDMKTLNPEVKKDWVAVTRRRPFKLLIPKGYSQKFASLNFRTKRPVARRSVSQSISRKVSSVYRVKRGDNLTGISKKFGLPIRKIKRANNIRGSKIMVGQRLSIPMTVSRYKVRRGDNLTVIARKFNTSIRKIVVANNLRGHRIYKGQSLIIPSES